MVPIMGTSEMGLVPGGRGRLWIGPLINWALIISSGTQPPKHEACHDEVLKNIVTVYAFTFIKTLQAR
jgi:hypothetical protein